MAVHGLHDQMGEASAHWVDDHVGDLADGTVGGFDGHALGEPDRDAAAGTHSVLNDDELPGSRQSERSVK